ncbi:MAG: hypothetical protein GX876_05760, partial [Bacteroidales bacterium]|nr:hypothetical protein [Bacteroidales bacterium]
MNDLSLSEQQQIRRNSLNELKKLGIDPYPAAGYKTNIFTADIHRNHRPDENRFADV